MPQALRKNAAEMIVAMLQSDPAKRPNVDQCLSYRFLTGHFIPASLPISCLSCEPRFDQLEGVERGDIGYNRRALTEVNDNNNLGNKRILK